jgi:polar amino acid transport system substrate-binding protein
MKKNLLTMAIILTLLISVTACSSKDSVGVVEEGKFIIGFDQDFPPMGFVGEDGEFTGFDIDLAKEVANRMDLEIVLQPIAWESKDLELSSKNIDCIWNGFTIDGRENDYTWSEPYMKNEQAIVVKAESGIKTIDDLAGKVVAVQIDSSAENAIEEDSELLDSFGDYIKVADYNTALMDLESGAVDAVAMDDIVASYQLSKRDSDLVELDEKLSSEEYGIGFLLGNEVLRDKVQSTLEEMAEDGTLEEISIKWFGKDITTIGK